MLAKLYPHSDNDPFLHPKDVARLIAQNFSDSTISWDIANDRLQRELLALEEMGTPEPILQGHRNLIDNTAYIEVRLPNSSSEGVKFFAYIHTAIDVEPIEPLSDSAEFDGLGFVYKLAKCLNYHADFGE